jgi:hypothetical protein
MPRGEEYEAALFNITSIKLPTGIQLIKDVKATEFGDHTMWEC